MTDEFDLLVGIWRRTEDRTDPEFDADVDTYEVFAADGNHFYYGYVRDRGADAVYILRGRWKRDGRFLTMSSFEQEVHFVGDVNPAVIEEFLSETGAFIKRLSEEELALLDERGWTLRYSRHRHLPAKFDFVM